MQHRKPKPRKQHRKPKPEPTTAIVRVTPTREPKPWDLNGEQVALLKNYLHMGDASDVEVQAGLEVARRYRLDPFKQGQIWFIKRWDANAVGAGGGKGAFVRVPQVGIYGMLHIAARDHKDFGSLSDPEYGPMFMHEVEGHKFKAPEWCRVKAFKKGVAEPTVATIYFEEFCPKKWDNVKHFWAPMARNQIAKCCKAQVIRFAYPDLGGLYIPEEMERMQDDYTSSGREIVPAGAGHPQSARQAAQNVLREKLEPLGLWCAKHGCGADKCPSDEHTREELEAFDAAVARMRSSAGAETGISTTSAPAEVAPRSAKPEPVPAIEHKYELTIDWTLDVKSPVLTGNVTELGGFLGTLRLDWKNDFWRARAEDVPAIMQIAGQNGFAIKEIHPGRVSSAPQQGAPGAQGKAKRDGSGPPTAASSPLVNGTIEKSIAGMVGTTPVRDVTLLLVDGKRPSYRCWDKGWFKYLDEGVGKAAQLVLKQNKKYLNVVGARKIGSREWDENGEQVLQKDREAGGKTLFT